MNDSKPFFLSNRIAGLVVVLLAIVLPDYESEQLEMAVNDIFVGLGWVWALWGSLRAKRRLTFKINPHSLRPALACVVCALAVTMVACTGATAIDDQEGQSGQGKDQWILKNCVMDNGTIYPCEVRVDVGRDKSSVKVRVRTPDNYEFDYEAIEATGRSQAEVRAEVEKAVVEGQVQIAPDAIPSVVDLILKLL